MRVSRGFPEPTHVATHGENVRPEYAKRIDKARTSSGLLFLLQQNDPLWILMPQGMKWTFSEV